MEAGRVTERVKPRGFARLFNAFGNSVRGFIGAFREEAAFRQELALAEAIPCFLGLDEPAEEIGPWAPTPRLRQDAEVARDLLGGAASPLDHLGADGQRNGVERPRHVP